MTLRPERTAYDDVPYPGYAYPQTHPSHLAAIATLLGLQPPAVERCRVLELGCTDGGNLIPMALALPGATFAGLDLSATQIEEGQARIAELGLTNITLLHRNILEVDADFGEFDYIIAHGVYSWVPGTVRDALLAICKRNLAPRGIAYISYNVYPGWHLFRPIRDLLRYHTAGVSDPAEQLARARELLHVLSQPRSGADVLGAPLTIAAASLKERIDAIQGEGEISILMHDVMEETNEPVYFHQFAEHAEQHGLQYLAESNFPSVLPHDLPEWANSQIRALATTGIDVEQYMDFFRGRTFRQTLLCHSELAIDRSLRPERLRGLAISSRSVVDGRDVELGPGAVQRFLGPDDTSLSIDTPISKAALLRLNTIWPQAVPFEALAAQAAAFVRSYGFDPGEPRAAELALGADLLTGYCYSSSLVGLHATVPAVPAELTNQPIASPLARIQARAGQNLTTLHHENTEPDVLVRRLVQILDGTRDRAALLAAAEGWLAAGLLPGDLKPEQLRDELERCLRWLYRAGLLIG
jgi:SAM-dependent methyltransferase